MRTGRRAGALSRRGRPLEAEALWAEQHEWGAGAIFDMLCDLKVGAAWGRGKGRKGMMGNSTTQGRGSDPGHGRSRLHGRCR